MTEVQCVRCYRKTTGDTGLCRPCYSMVFPDLFEASHPDKQRRRVCSDCSKHLVQPPEKQCEDCKRQLKRRHPRICASPHTPVKRAVWGCKGYCKTCFLSLFPEEHAKKLQQRKEVRTDGGRGCSARRVCKTCGVKKRANKCGGHCRTCFKVYKCPSHLLVRFTLARKRQKCQECKAAFASSRYCGYCSSCFRAMRPMEYADMLAERREYYRAKRPRVQQEVSLPQRKRKRSREKLVTQTRGGGSPCSAVCVAETATT